MKALDDLGSRLGTASELLAFFWHLKMWWIIPIVVVLLFFGLLVVIGSTTGVGPFVYTLF